MPPPAPGDSIELAGVRTHIVVDEPRRTEDGVPAVLSSGLAGNWFDWDHCAALLALRRRVVRLDRPGYGLSDPWPNDVLPTIDAEVRRFAGLLDHLEIERAVLVGHSMASFYVEAFARIHPDRTAGIVVLDGSVEDTPHPVLPERTRSRLVLGGVGTTARLRLGRLAAPAVRKVLIHSAPPGGFTEGQRAWYRQIVPTDRYMVAALLENAQYPIMARELLAVRERYPRLTAPVTVAAAFSGRPSPWAAHWSTVQRRYAARLSGEFAVVSPAGHHMMIDQPGQVAALVERVRRR
ncbi:alpha/beta fold hydrolase [Tsukamurella soli]|uniref:Alpha/beta hydrolase n=1 Tax=Tsukamurella soli TaxID=644556 RepID=A0ABP8JKF7_9ACTN